MDKRKSQRLFRYAVDEFRNIMSQCQERDVFYDCNDKDTAAWNKFVEEFEKRKTILGEEFVKNFVQFSANFWLKQETKDKRSYLSKIRFQWIVASPAIRRWFAN